MKFNKETHTNLRGGNGIVTTYTKGIYLFNRLLGQFIIIELNSGSTIGMHTHTTNSEIYFTMNRNIRFCENEKWKNFNYCKKGSSHSAENISSLSRKQARIYAFKF